MRKTIALFIAAGLLCVLAVAGRRASETETGALPPTAPLPHALALFDGAARLEAVATPSPGATSAAIDLRLRARAHPETGASSRPHAIALVLDRSGSMEGRPLEAAREAALAVADALGDDDHLALVSYGSDATVDLPLTRAGEIRERAHDVLLDLIAGGGTHLSAGVAAAFRALASAPEGSARHVVVLSDGRANQGLTDPVLLAELVERGARAGVGLSTVGVGASFDAETLTRLAEAGGGRHRVAERPDDLVDAFVGEVRALERFAARGVEVGLELPVGVELGSVRGAKAERRGDRWVVRFGDLAAGETRSARVVLSLRPEVETRPAVAFDLSRAEGVARPRGRIGLAPAASSDLRR